LRFRDRGRIGNQRQESNMSSTRDPILMLEPSNLLEPLDLADRQVDPANPSARPAGEGTSSRRFMRPARGDSISASAAITRDRSSVDRSWRLKSALLVAGAFACFAAGAALPQLPDLAFGDAKPAQQPKSAQQTKSASAQQTIAEATKQPVRVKEAPATSLAESKPAEPKPNESASNGSNQSVANQSVALTANTDAQSAVSAPDQKSSTAQSAPATPDATAGVATSCSPQNRARDDKCLEGGVPAPAAGSTRTPAPDRNSDGSPRSAPATSRTTGASTVKPPAAPQTIWEIDERAQQPVNRRATQRDTADQPAAADNNGQSAKSSDRSRRRERSADDNGQTARYGNSRQEQDFNRNSGGRRDRYDEYARGDDRRVFGRAPREDDRVIDSGPPRHEGPMPIFPSLFGW
jgi:hypothetical protein